MNQVKHKPRASPPGECAKAMGAFYTDAQVADFLVWWAVRSRHNTVMDPSFGGGVFLRSACKRLVKLGGRPRNQVYGAELDPNVHARIAEELSGEFGVNRRHLLPTDFFALDAAAVKKVEVVVGNPPFIRYQRFSGGTRRAALMRAASCGVRLTELSSSWAPFLVHSVAMLKDRGRLAMVVPMEIGHAAYARPVLEHLAKSFGKVVFLTFQKRLFPGLSEDTLLLLGEDKGCHSSGFLLRDFAHPGLLAEVRRKGKRALSGTCRVSTQAITRGRERLVEYFIPKEARDLYRRLKRGGMTQRLGELADVGIGYVTGANSFFHLSPEEARNLGVPGAFLRPAVRRGRAFAGLRFTMRDWRNAANVGDASYLLSIPAEAELPQSVRRYLEYGQDQGVPSAYKCRTRSPWFHVPNVNEGDAFLSYMSGHTTRLAANVAHVVAPNTLHVLRFHPQTTLPKDGIPALWRTSLSQLSAEIEGHSLGGGMLKLEPTEAEKVVLASWRTANGKLVDIARELDALLRNGLHEIAQARADSAILREGMGLSRSDCRLLKKAAETLRKRRYSRSSAA